ncbi:MAG TPA: methyltransferase domain-containing protein [Deinococcales bacterium]|nr:methyltransferase domain-containing protein [Deinococcales bacterium]
MTDIYEAPDIYDLQYESYRTDVPWYAGLADNEGGPVLELGCGTGRLTEALARAGADVTGLELSGEMLERARRRLGSRAVLVQGDMRQPQDSFLENGSFRLVLAPFNVLMHLYTLDDQDAALAGAYALLEPGGLLALDLDVPDIGPPDDIIQATPEWNHLAGPGGQVFMRQLHDPLKQVITSHYLLDSVTEDGFVKRRELSLRQRYWRHFEVRRALRQAGFRQIRFYGGFDRRRFDEHAEHMVVTCRRPA